MLEQEEKLFQTLNQKLKDAELDLTVIVAGGFILSHYGVRTTHDIDGFYQSSQDIERIIREVGEQFNLNTKEKLWLNNSVQNLNAAPPEDICEILYNYSNLKVLMPRSIILPA